MKIYKLYRSDEKQYHTLDNDLSHPYLSKELNHNPQYSAFQVDNQFILLTFYISIYLS